LPKSRYGIMTTESIVAFLGDSQESAAKVCNEASCLAEIGRKVNADYVAQARIGRFGGELSINFELYNSRSGNLIDQFTGSHQKIFGLLAIIDENAPILFKKLSGTSGGTLPPTIPGGIVGIQTTGGDYEFEGRKRYLVYLKTEPPGAVLSFDGEPNSQCAKTPCSLELPERNVHIRASLDQYERADTTVSIKYNNQNISIPLKSNFGILDIKPAYLDGIGNDIPWNMSINDKPYSLGEIRLSPKEYAVKLSHECYEDITFKAGINKNKREVFNMANTIILKKGGLNLSAEADDEPVSEPVYVNDRQIGATPIERSVPICATIEIGADKEIVNVKIKHNDNAPKKYTHKMDTEKRRQRLEEEETEEEEREERRRKWQERKEEQTDLAIRAILFMGVGWSSKSPGTQWNPLNLELYNQNLTFLRFGTNLDGWNSKKINHIKAHLFTRLYPTDFIFLSGGVGWDYYNYNEESYKISTPVFPVGGGVAIAITKDNDRFLEFVIEGLYNIRLDYITINFGLRMGGPM